MGKKSPFKYEINEIVNDSLKIKKQTNNKRDVCILDFDEDTIRAVYIPNDDLTLDLIWKDGELI